MTEATDRNRVRIDGDFTGIKFSARVKDNKVVQTAVLNFELELTDRGRDELKKLIDWQTETVGVDIVRRQPKLDFGEKSEDQGKLPLAPLICRICGCMEEKACVITPNYSCSWVDGEKNLCDNPACLRAAEYTEERIREIWKDA